MTHDQVRQLVRRINPVPDPSALESVDVSVPALERRTEMQVDERPLAEERGDSRWRGPLLGIAAAVAVLLGGGIFFLTNDDMPVATPAPNAMALPGEFQPIAPGAYFVDTDGNEETTTRGTFVIQGNEWLGFQSGVMKNPDDDNDYVSLIVVEVDQMYTSVCDPGHTPVAAGSTAAGLANQFASNGLTVREALAPVRAFGHDGHSLVMEVPAGCAGEAFQAWIGGAFDGRYYQAEGQIVEYWFLDVEGTTVMVEANSFPESSEEDVAELRAVLDTLVITP